MTRLMIENFLEDLGLNSNEVQVYMYLLSHGGSIASIIAKRLTIKRVTVYAVLESLEKKEFVVSGTENKVKHFEAVEPDDILYLCERKVDHFNELKRKAKVLQKEFKVFQKQAHKMGEMYGATELPKLEIRGKIKYYEGLDGVRDLLEESLLEKPEDQIILCFGLNEFHAKYSNFDWKQYTQKRVKNGLKVLSIQPDTEAAKAYKSRDDVELRETRLVPKKDYPSMGELNVIGNMIAMFTVQGDSPVAIKMYNPALAQSLKSVFMLAWKKAGEVGN